MNKHVICTKDYVREIEKSHRYVAFGNFLDRFREDASYFDKEECIKYPPDDDEKYPVEVAILSATVEILAKAYGVLTPDWVFDEKYILDEPYYGEAMTESSRQSLKKRTPPEFARRNIYLGHNVLSRM